MSALFWTLLLVFLNIAPIILVLVVIKNLREQVTQFIDVLHARREYSLDGMKLVVYLDHAYLETSDGKVVVLKRNAGGGREVRQVPVLR